MSETAAVAPSASAARIERRRRLVGIGLMCLALFCFSGLDASAKWLNRSVDPMLTVWARYLSAVALVFVVINPWTRPGVLRTNRLWLQIIRSVLLFCSTAANFMALQYLQLVEALSIVFATPLLVALLSGPILGERAGPRRLAAIGVGFIGVLMITRPGLGAMHPAALLSLAGSVAYAFYNIVTRILATSDRSETTLVYSGLAGVALTTPLVPFVWSTPDSLLTWALLIGLGAFGSVGHWLLILAHARAPAPVLAPFIYTQIVWMLALGYFVFGDWPDPWTFIGASVVIASGLYLFYRERARPARDRLESEAGHG
ncbi:MAG TPA: DMT family transporter [Microvirga sp.]|jgi:drug/metabolite transporter (DMT)-like permease|nr:DMT family transporter [Microvirga sp.]